MKTQAQKLNAIKMSEQPTPETDAFFDHAISTKNKYPAYSAPFEGFCQKLERERDEAREALMKIEEVFIESDDTYEDLIKMGNIARAVLEAAK